MRRRNNYEIRPHLYKPEWCCWVHSVSKVTPWSWGVWDRRGEALINIGEPLEASLNQEEMEIVVEVTYVKSKTIKIPKVDLVKFSSEAYAELKTRLADEADAMSWESLPLQWVSTAFQHDGEEFYLHRMTEVLPRT